MGPLVPAEDLVRKVSRPYPNESIGYRRARAELLREEIELRRHIERVNEQRRALPPGGEAPGYQFLDAHGRQVGLEDLFGRHDTLLTYYWMFGLGRERPCPMCTCFLGSIDIPTRDLTQRLAVAIIGSSPVERQLAFAHERGWRYLRFFQPITGDFARDYRAIDEAGAEVNAMDVWTKSDGVVRHFWGAEFAGTADPGQDARGAPDTEPLWTILDLTPAGRGSDWYPSLDYP